MPTATETAILSAGGDASRALAIVQSNAVMAMHARKFRIPGDVVNKATANLPENQRGLIRWLHAHGAEHDMSLAELAGKIRYDDSTLSRVFRGEYDGNLGKICDAIASYKDLAERRASIKRAPFVMTNLARKMWKVFEASLTFQKVVYVYGESQIGKTTAGIEFARTHNHGETIYVRMPAGGAMSNFLEELAISLRISPQQKEKELRRRVVRSFDDRMLLIIDQAHECFRSQYSHRATMSLLFAMEIHDRSGCGLVIMGTNTLREEIEQGRMKGVLRQLGLRSLLSLQLPNRPSTADLNKFSDAYGLESPEKEALQLQTEIIRDYGLGQWCCHLQAASRIASKHGKKLAWSHVLDAHAGIKALERSQD
ncbi:MAG: AAA family ATPase [Verrucomicrobia bacterium]|nr:AAA family ATPase [Verrucomicrobiota bacterium]